MKDETFAGFPSLAHLAKALTGRKALLFIILRNAKPVNADGWIPLSYTELSSACAMAKPNAVAMANKLVQAGIVEKRKLKKQKTTGGSTPPLSTN